MSRLAPVTGALVVSVLAAAPAEAAPPGLAELVGAPYAEALVSAAAAPRLAWTVTERGAVNVWTAAAPTFAARPLTRFGATESRPVTALDISPDGTVVALVRGAWGGSNAASQPDGGGQEIALLTVATGGLQSLGPGSDPRFAPDGRLVMRRGPDLWIRDDGGLRPLLKGVGRIGRYAWSPDGRAVAFESGRDGRTVIGVYGLGAPAVRWLVPGLDDDLHPTWSPDGRQVAFLRLGGQPAGAPPREWFGVPLAVLAADVVAGTAVTLWREPGRNGGQVQDSRAQALRWRADGTLQLYSEHDGWTRLYALSEAGAAPRPISPAHCEAAADAPLPDGSAVVVTNCGDLDRPALWRAQPGRAAQRLTDGPAIETDPAPVAGGRYLAFREGGVRSPQGVSLLDLQTGVRRRLGPAPSFDPAGLATPVSVRFPAADGREARGQVLATAAAPGVRRPAIVFVHGGPTFQTYAGWHEVGVFGMSYAVNQDLARRGYVVLQLNYRSGTGYGRAHRLAPGVGPRGASEYADVLGAARYLQGRPDVDPARIGIWGGSYGGYLTALALARDSNLFAAGADISGFHDWTDRWARGGSPAETYGVDKPLEPLAWASSPLADLPRWRSPVLIAAGDDDRIIPVAESLNLARRLRAQGVPVVDLIEPDEQHIFVDFGKLMRKLDLMAAFFDCTLRRSDTTAPAACPDSVRPTGRAASPTATP